MAAQTFQELKTEEARVRALELELAPLFNGGTFDRDISDMRQIAHAVAAEVPFFVTRDTPLLDRSDPVFEKYGLRILHPTDLVNRLDMLRREAEYRPACGLEGPNGMSGLLSPKTWINIVSLFKT